MLIVLVVLVIGVGGWYYWGKSTPTKNAPVDSPSGLDYRQQKVAEGAYILKDRDSIKQTLTKQEKVDTNLKENKEAIQLAQKGKESYQWEVKLASGTVFAFGKQTREGILPVVKVTDKDGYFVRYYPQKKQLVPVKPNVKGNVITWEISQGVQARYTMQQDRVKADYIVATKEAIKENRLKFVVEFSNGKESSLNPEILPSGEIIWLKENDNEAFTFPVPLISDANKQTFEGTYDLSESGDGIATLSVILPKDKLLKATYPLIVDPVVIDNANIIATGTGYGNGRRIVRDAWGNLFAMVSHTAGTFDTLYYKNYNATSWIAGTTLHQGVGGIDIDSTGRVHVVSLNGTSLRYKRATITRNSSNEVTNISAVNVTVMDSSTLANRPSVVVANKGMGAGKEKVVAAWSMNTTSGGTRFGEIRVMQCDVADDCTSMANWYNASEEQGGSATACASASTTTGVPSAANCPGAADTLFQTTVHDTHHGVISQMPAKERRLPSGSKVEVSSSFTDMPNARDGNLGTLASVSSLGSSDYFYIGDTKPFSKVSVNMTASTNTTETALDVEYCSAVNGSNVCTAWSDVSNGVDNTFKLQASINCNITGCAFNEDGSVLFDEPTSWSSSLLDTDTSPLYWIRIRPTVGFDSSTTMNDVYINDRNSRALYVVGWADSQTTMQYAYVPWDDIAQAGWENNPASSGNPWRSSSTVISVPTWSTFTNFPLSMTVDEINQRIYLGYISGTAVGTATISVHYFKSTSQGLNSGFGTGIAGSTVGADTAFSLTADQGNIYLFYVPNVDDTTNGGLSWKKCNDPCNLSPSWGPANSFVSFASTTYEPSHPQAVVTKAFGDTVALDVLYTNTLGTSTVEYERHYVDMADKLQNLASGIDDGYHRACVSGTHDSDVNNQVLLGREASDSNCDSSVDSLNHIGLRYASVSIPQGSIVSSAYLDIQVKTRVGTGTVNFTIYGHDTDNSATYSNLLNAASNSTSLMGNMTKTTSNYSYAIDFTTNRYRLDVTDIIQEIVCRGATNAQPCVGTFNDSGTWASGNAISLFLIATDAGSTDNNIIIDNIVDTFPAKLQVNLGEAGKNLSMGSSTQIASGSASFSDLDHPMSSGEVNYIDTDDDVYASVAATMNYASSSAQPTFMFKMNNSNNNNTYKFTASAKVKSSVSTVSRPVYLQVYRGGSTNDWVTVAQNNTTAGETEFSLDPPEISTNVTEYYFADSPGLTCTSSSSNCWTYWRLYQEAPADIGQEVLSVDYFSVTYSDNSSPASSSHIRGGTIFRGGSSIR